MSLYMCFYVPTYVHLISYSCKQRDWKITAGRRSGSWSQNNPRAQELLLWDPICPIKKILLADASSFALLWGAPGAKDKDMCFHALERGCGEYLKVKTQTGSIYKFEEALMSSLWMPKCSLTNVMITSIKKWQKISSLLFSSSLILSTFPCFSLTLSLGVSSEQHVFAVWYLNVVLIRKRTMLILSGRPPRILISVCRVQMSHPWVVFFFSSFLWGCTRKSKL